MWHFNSEEASGHCYLKGTNRFLWIASFFISGELILISSFSVDILLTKLFSIGFPQKKQTVFDFRPGMVAGLSLDAFISRFVTTMLSTEETLTLSILLIDRFVVKTGIKISNRNIFRLFAAAFTVASKLHEEYFYCNAVSCQFEILFPFHQQQKKTSRFSIFRLPQTLCIHLSIENWRAE